MLTSMQQCSINDGCLPATSFTWGEPDPAVARAFTSKGVWSGPVLEDRVRTSTATAGHSQDDMYIAGDFDGDGRKDLMTRIGSTGIKLYKNGGTGFEVSQPFPSYNGSFVVVETGDFDGDGQSDVLLAQGESDLYGFVQVTNNIFSNWKICYSRLKQGQGFQCSDWNVDGVNAVQRKVYDFNADGRDDLYFSGGSPGDGNLGVQRVCISTGTGFVCTVVTALQGVPLRTTKPGIFFTQYVPLTTADLDGDGRLDEVTSGQAEYIEGNSWIFLEPYITTESYSSDIGLPVERKGGGIHTYELPPGNFNVGASGVAGDVNGDGYSDVIFNYGPTPTASLETRRCISKGLLGLPYCEQITNLSTTPTMFWYVGNFEGDGAPRVVIDRPFGGNTSVRSCTVRSGNAVNCSTWTMPASPAVGADGELSHCRDQCQHSVEPCGLTDSPHRN